jgi:hypothetical protein
VREKDAHILGRIGEKKEWRIFPATKMEAKSPFL